MIASDCEHILIGPSAYGIPLRLLMHVLMCYLRIEHPHAYIHVYTHAHMYMHTRMHACMHAQHIYGVRACTCSAHVYGYITCHRQVYTPCVPMFSLGLHSSSKAAFRFTEVRIQHHADGEVDHRRGRSLSGPGRAGLTRVSGLREF